MLLKKYAHVIDTFDAYLGPIASLTKYSSDETYNQIHVIAKTIDLGMKIPFLTAYFLTTGDYLSVSNLILRETLAYTLPMGGFLELRRNYENLFKEK